MQLPTDGMVVNASVGRKAVSFEADDLLCVRLKASERESALLVCTDRIYLHPSDDRRQLWSAMAAIFLQLYHLRGFWEHVFATKPSDQAASDVPDCIINLDRAVHVMATPAHERPLLLFLLQRRGEPPDLVLNWLEIESPCHAEADRVQRHLVALIAHRRSRLGLPLPDVSGLRFEFRDGRRLRGVDAFSRALWPPPRQRAPEADEQQQLCCICMEARRNVVFLLCGHMCACRACADKVSECPVCRAAPLGVHDKITVFL